MDSVAQIIRFLMGGMNICLMVMLAYQLFISAFGFHKRGKDYQDFDPRLRFLILVPAHNEEAVIGDIIDNLNHMEYPRELYDFYIIADNCDDRTAVVSRQMGAKVIESFKEEHEATGKPVALQKAFRALEGYQNQYDLVMIFDADNLIDPNMFLEVNSQFLSNEGKVDIIQCYLGCKNKKGLVALFYYVAYTTTNRFFQYAKSCLNLNSVVGGTGFAVSTEYLYKRGGWTSMSLTEDFELQIESTCDGKRILWNHNVRIYDEKPTSLRASFRQRTRWAQGHWFVAFKNTRLVFKALKEKRIPFREFLSTFLYMYSLVPYVLLALQIFLGAVLLLLEWTGSLSPVEAQTNFTFWNGLALLSIPIFLYTFVFLYFVADRMDNGNRVNLRMLLPMSISMIANTLVTALAQIVGLFKHKQQNNWDKTEHNINCLTDTPLLPKDSARSKSTILAEQK